MKQLPLFLCVLGVATLSWGQSDTGGGTPTVASAGNQAAAEPKMTLSNEKPDARLLIAEHDLIEANFQNADPLIIFPSRARLENVYDGVAAVAVAVDADGNPTDFLAVKYSKPYFSEALISSIRHQEFSPRRVKGTTVASRFYVVRKFSLQESDPNDPNRPSTVSMNAMEHMESNSQRVSDSKNGPKLAYKAHEERELDGGILKATTVVSPAIPAGFEMQPGQPIKIIVSFYVDETGSVHAPNVDSCSPPELTDSVIKSVLGWKFAPPTIKGKAVLVFTNRTITLEIKLPASGAAGSKLTAEPGK